MKTKLLLYCTKGKPYLFNRIIKGKSDGYYTDIVPYDIEDEYLCGKIVAECECEVEKNANEDVDDVPHAPFLEETCLTFEQLDKYVWLCGGEPFYALHLSNIKVFEKPLTIEALYQPIDNNFCKGCKEYNTCDYAKSKNKPCKKVLLYAPQNMMWVWYNGQDYVLISIRPEWLCKILNGEKTIEVRRKILKGML